MNDKQRLLEDFEYFSPFTLVCGICDTEVKLTVEEEDFVARCPTCKWERKEADYLAKALGIKGR